MDMRIRNAEIEEAELLAAIEAECFPAAEAATAQEIKKRMEVFLENFFVAQVQGKVVGFINGGTARTPELPDEFYHNTALHDPQGAYQTVFGLNVLPSYRRRGIAGKLLEHLAEVSLNRGKKGVILTCKEHLLPFYESHGFVNFGIADSNHGGARWYLMKRIF